MKHGLLGVNAAGDVMKASLQRRSRGVVLIVVLGILLVLALLATTFATLQRVERLVSRNYLDGVRAKLLAQSGVEYGISRLRSTFEKEIFYYQSMEAKSWGYYGNDLAEVGNNPVLLNIPLEKAQNPSMAYENELVQNPADAVVAPRMVPVDGVQVGFSGMMESGAYGRNADHYSLRVTDLQGLIYVNDGLDQGSNGSVSQNLKRILNNLCHLQGVTQMGTQMVDNRPPGGYKVKA